MSDKEMPVLIYTMGRVSSGSCSIALSKSGYARHFHVHTMNEDWRRYSGRASPADGMSEQEIKRYEHDRKVRSTIIDSRQKALVVSFIREPLTRNMSAFFMTKIQQKNLFNDRSSEGLRRAFLKRYPHYVPLMWYQKEFNKVLGLNVFEHPFDVDLGYTIIEHGPYRILLLRTELSDPQKGKAISEFLSTDVEIERAKKVDKYELSEETNELYTEFKKQVSFRPEFLDYLYSSEYCKKFMSTEEIRSMKERWSSEAAAQVPWRISPTETVEL